MSSASDPVAVMGAAIMNAIVHGSRAEDGTALVDPDAARRALIVALSMLLEADPAIRTPKDMREAGEGIARDVRVQLRTFREHHQATGIRAWDAVPVTMN